MKRDNTILRSEVVRDILSSPPNMILSWGNTVIALIILVFVFLSYFIKYPDVLEGRAILTSTVSPTYFHSHKSGRIQNLLKKEGEFVKEGTKIISFKSEFSIEQINHFKDFLDKIERNLNSFNFVELEYQQLPYLGSLQNEYFQISSLYNQIIKDSIGMNNSQQVEYLTANLNSYREIAKVLVREYKFSESELLIAKEKFNMQEDEFEKEFISKSNFLDSKLSFSRVERNHEALHKAMIQNDISVRSIKNQIIELEISSRTRYNNSINELHKMIINSKDLILTIEKDLFIKSPVSGILTYVTDLDNNSYLNADEKVFAVLKAVDSIRVKAYLPKSGFGKLQIGDPVHLILAGYPQEEFGIIESSVSSIKTLPIGDEYEIQLELCNGLVSTFGKNLDLSSEMNAKAKFITADYRLIERVFNKIRNVLD